MYSLRRRSAPVFAPSAVLAACIATLLPLAGCSIDRNGTGPIVDASPDGDARVDSGDGSAGCPDGFFDANGDPSDGCEYACTRTASPVELCDGLDNDCDPSSPDGSGEPTLGDGCDGDDADLCPEGTWQCVDGAMVCDDTTGDSLDICNGVDDDCDPSTEDGATEVGVGCDGDDPDSCAGGTTVCIGGVLSCDDPGGAGVEICDGVDNDCDPSTADGSADPMLGAACDGADADLCEEGTLSSCVDGALVCDDATGDVADVCDGVDNDCDPSTADGSADPMLGAACDGPDADLCAEGVFSSCVDGALVCDDTTGDVADVCDGVDNDCDPSTSDGSADPMLGAACDGADADLCEEGTFSGCAGGSLVCSDTTGDTLDVCDGVDNDCDPSTSDGSADPMLGATCDGADSDLCEEGTLSSCVGGSLVCDDATGDTLDVCDGMDNDCNPATLDGADDTRVGVACDGPDADLCKEGTSVCSGGAIGCNDITGDNREYCDGMDNDCDPSTADGAGDPDVGIACDGPDLDRCAEGTNRCLSGAISCSDTTGDTPDTCDGTDDDCDPSTPDGSSESWYGVACDGPDTDVCKEGTFDCVAGGQVCGDMTGDSVEVCDGLDNDCDGSIDEGDVCSRCVTHQYAGHAYLYCSDARDWRTAQGQCRGKGNYDLVTITSAAEETFVESHIGSTTYWIGLNDRTTEGSYQWSNGEAFGYNDWGSGEPGGALKDCVDIYDVDMAWHPWYCSTVIAYICESQ